MKVLICGGRDYTNRENFFWFVNHTINPHDGHTIISGGAKGADSLAIDYARTYGLPLKVYKADWKTFDKRAGPIRNIEMLAEGDPDLVIAFPGGAGTAHMVEISKKAGVKVVEIKDYDQNRY